MPEHPGDADPKLPRFTDPLGMTPGRFCTLINIGHTPEFFALDFRAVTPEGEACLLGRFFVTPQHAKRLARALAENIDNYEKQYGAIGAAAGPGAAEEPNAN